MEEAVDATAQRPNTTAATNGRGTVEPCPVYTTCSGARGRAGQYLLRQAEKLEPQPQLLVAFGLVNVNPRPMSSSLKSTVVPSR